MQVEQAVYTSIQGDQVHGYHLVARSPGIDDSLAQLLTHWGPSHGALISAKPNASSLNFHSADKNWFAVTRSVYGDWEYSDRGGLRLMTLMLLLTADQMAKHRWDPLELSQRARSIGALRLQLDLPQQLPRIELPIPMKFSADVTSSDDPTPWAARARQIVDAGGRVALIGSLNPLDILAQIIELTPLEERFNLDFTTGLRPSLHRPFRIHFLPSDEQELARQLVSQGVTRIDVVA